MYYILPFGYACNNELQLYNFIISPIISSFKFLLFSHLQNYLYIFPLHLQHYMD